ncbi:MAG: alpha/beta fold hydrolase [Candidatus Pelagadaptatus aseana]|uniref:alpha/beta fold hydrolase n=1 Tax=Candidatus Pelagadaptatus aseana TaxID=3120508 RepID=UPI0039B2CEAD
MHPSLNTRFINPEKSGIPVLLVHGLFGAGENLLGIARAIDDRPVCLVDLRNHGRSFHADSMTQRDMAEDIARLIRGQGWHRVDYIGHSLGGKVGIQLSQDHPELIHKLLVADIAPVDYEPGHDDIFAAFDAVDPSVVASRREADGLMQAHLSESGVRSFLLTNLVRAESGGFQWRCNLDAIKAGYESVRCAPDLVMPFEGAVLYIRGGASDYVLPQDEWAIHQYHPNADIKTLEGTGHWLHAEKPQEFNALVCEFLDQ